MMMVILTMNKSGKLVYTGFLHKHFFVTLPVYICQHLSQINTSSIPLKNQFSKSYNARGHRTRKRYSQDRSPSVCLRPHSLFDALTQQ